MNYFVLNSELKNTCEFNSGLFESSPSVYEVIRLEEGVPLFLHDHITRFYHSLSLSGFQCSLTEHQIRSRIKALIETNRIQTGLVKFVFTNHAVAGELFAAWVIPFFFPAGKTYQSGVNMMSYNGKRDNPNVKLSNQKIREQSNRLISDNDVYEVILLSEHNVISEGSRSNLFFVSRGILYTPHHSLILNGITRQKVIELALASGIDVLESSFQLNEIACCEAAFITGTTPKVLPVREIDTFSFEVSNPVVQHLSEKYDELIANYVGNFSW